MRITFKVDVAGGYGSHAQGESPRPSCMSLIDRDDKQICAAPSSQDLFVELNLLRRGAKYINGLGS